MKKQFSDIGQQVAQDFNAQKEGKQGKVYKCPGLLPGGSTQATTQGRGTE